jgi:hypothetical protein
LETSFEWGFTARGRNSGEDDDSGEDEN